MAPPEVEGAAKVSVVATDAERDFKPSASVNRGILGLIGLPGIRIERRREYEKWSEAIQAVARGEHR